MPISRHFSVLVVVLNWANEVKYGIREGIGNSFDIGSDQYINFRISGQIKPQILKAR